MIKVISEPEAWRVSCHGCGRQLEYTAEDVKEVQTHMNEFSKYIECPKCGKRIQVD